MKDFSQPAKTINPWRREGTFFNWCQEWYNRTYEEPVRAVFVNSLIAHFLFSEKGMTENEIARCFRREFRGEGKKGFKTPACVWRDRESVQITGMACDFLLLPPLPVTVGEVKVAMPHQTVVSNITKIKEDLSTCEEWLDSETTEYIDKFEIRRFEFGLAILIDLTGGSELQNLYKSSIVGGGCKPSAGVIYWVCSFLSPRLR